MPIDVFNTTGDDTQMTIKNKIKLGVGCISLLVCANVLAWPFSPKLTYYRCPNSMTANSCDSNCTEMNGIKMEFKVDVKQKLVFYSQFKDGSQIGSGRYENCNTFDKENWICKTEYPGAIFEEKMSNGIYIASSTIFPARMGGKLDLSYFCAK